MEWNKAKYFVILLLILLNGVLAGLNYQKNQENILTSSQEKAIFEVLANNGVSLYTELITKFPPMRKVAMQIPSYSREELKNIYFSGEDTTVSVEFNRIIIKSADKTLTMEGNQGLLEFPEGTSSLPALSLAQAQKLASTFIDKLPIAENPFVIGNTIQTANGYIVEYFEEYKGQTIFASYYRIWITEKGIEKIQFTYFEPDGFTGEKKEICFSDEALLTFLLEIKKMNLQTPVTITAMELGYDFQDIDIMETTDKLVPVYRIYVLGQEKPFVINAYTNEMIMAK